MRTAGEEDFQRIMEIEQRSYPAQLNTRLEILQFRHRVFGIWVAELDGLVVGFNTCVPAALDWPEPDLAHFSAQRHPDYRPWFEDYRAAPKRAFNSLVNTSTAVEDRFQGQGVGTALVANSLQVAREHGLRYRVSALRCEYAAYRERSGQSIEQYIRQVNRGEEVDRYLALYRRLGFVFAAPLPDYEPDSGSLNYCVFSYFDHGS